MKKLFLYILLGTISISSCKSNDEEAIVEVAIDTQNTYDDQAAQKFLTDYYFDSQGVVVAFSSTETFDDNYPSLSTYNPTILPSGVIIVKRPSAQPAIGKTINDTDVLRLTSVSNSFYAAPVNGVATYTSQQSYRNTVGYNGVPEKDPFYFYTKVANLNSKARSYYEIEGFQEGIKYFKSCEIPDSDNYNLQGVIIVPSRAAYARDSNSYDYTYNGVTIKYSDRSFVFNIQVYKTTTRTAAEL